MLLEFTAPVFERDACHRTRVVPVHPIGDRHSIIVVIDLDKGQIDGAVQVRGRVGA